MRSPDEVLHFVLEQPDPDPGMLEAALRTLGPLVRPNTGRHKRLSPGWNPNMLADDGRFHSLLGLMAARLDIADARTVALSVDAVARLHMQPTPPQAVWFAEQVSTAAAARANTFPPQHLTRLAVALATVRVRGETGAALGPAASASAPRFPSTRASLGVAVEFVRGEALRQMQEFDAANCTDLLDAFRRWGIADHELANVALERFQDLSDEWTCKDVVEMAVLLSKTGARAEHDTLLHEMVALVSRRLDQFGPKQIVHVGYAAARLQCLSSNTADKMLQHLLPSYRWLPDAEVSQLLFLVAMAEGKRHPDLIRILVAQYANGVDAPVLSRDLDAAWAMCALGFVQPCAPPLIDILHRVFSSRNIPKGRLQLLKLFDVLHASKGSALPCIAGTAAAELPRPPRAWYEACAEVAHTEATRVLSSCCTHDEVECELAGLQFHVDSDNQPRRVVRLQRGALAGPFPVDFVLMVGTMDAEEPAEALVLDIELPGWPVTKAVRHQALKQMGYKAQRLQYWQWVRTSRSPHDRVALLQRLLRRALSGTERRAQEGCQREGHRRATAPAL